MPAMTLEDRVLSLEKEISFLKGQINILTQRGLTYGPINAPIPLRHPWDFGSPYIVTCGDFPNAS